MFPFLFITFSLKDQRHIRLRQQQDHIFTIFITDLSYKNNDPICQTWSWTTMFFQHSWSNYCRDYGRTTHSKTKFDTIPSSQASWELIQMRIKRTFPSMLGISWMQCQTMTHFVIIRPRSPVSQASRVRYLLIETLKFIRISSESLMSRSTIRDTRDSRQRDGCRCYPSYSCRQHCAR